MVKWLCAPRGPERRAGFFFEQVRALVARGGFYSFGQMALRSARARGREGCFESPLPTSGLHSPRNELRAARPFQTPKELSKPKNASRFAKRIFGASPIYGFAEGVTFQQDFTFSKGVKSAAKQQIGETRKKR